MKSISTAPRIHPLMAVAALSVITVSLAGAAAITGLLPTSHSANAPEAVPLVSAPAATAPQMLAPVAAPVVAPEPVRVAAAEEAPVVKRKPQPKPQPERLRPAPRPTQVAYNDAPSYRAPEVQQAPAPAPAPAQPNYVGIGAGAVIGGLLGNQIGSGNGKKLATVAGMIGGGMIGNEIQNRTRD
jgi:uncharacterized protein YcfJ